MKNFNWLLFVILLLVFFPAALVYLVYFLVKTPDQYPACGNGCGSGHTSWSLDWYYSPLVLTRVPSQMTELNIIFYSKS
jgi:hypothetical protein